MSITRRVMQMDMKKIKKNLNKAWNRNLMHIGCFLLVVIVFLELLVFAISYKSGRIDIPISRYFITKILLPTAIQTLCIGIMYLVYKNKIPFLKDRQREGIMCYSLLFVVMICALANRYYHVLWVAPCVSLYLHSVYAEKKEVKKIYIITNLFVILCTILEFIKGDYQWDYLAMTVVCALGMMYIFYSVAKLLAGFHAEQLEYLQESYKQQDELIKELQIDPMTGLYNKNALFDKLKKFIKKKEKKQQISYLAMLDLDYFKRVNDTYGHVSGDAVICRLASLIKKYMNADIEGFRFGGEEFILLFQNNVKENVLFTIEQICKEMRESEFEFDLSLRVTLSVGIAEYEQEMSHEMWIQKADEALYYAKNNGRNQIKLAK